MDETITISMSRYLELVRKEERIEAVARMIDHNEFLATIPDVASVLGIERKEKQDD